MKLQGTTLIEIVISLLIISIISLTASAAYSTAGNISMHAEDIREESDNMAEKMAEMYLDYNIKSGKSCQLQINGDISINGELLEADSGIPELDSLLAVRPTENETTEEDEDNEEESED